MMNHIKNRSGLLSTRRKLRKNPTSSESVLWKYIKSKQLDGIKFRRQFSIGNYILDFYCPKHKLAIELDGANHFTEVGLKKDDSRDEYLISLGIRVLRFENDLVMKRLETVLSIIKEETYKHQ